MARSYTVNINVDDPTNAVWFQKVGNISTQNQYFPNTIYGEASFDLTAFFWHGDVGIDGTPEAGTTPANFEVGDTLTLKGRIEDQPSGVAPVDLAVGAIVGTTNEILFDVEPNIVPNEWSQVDLDTTAKYPIAIWFTGTHEGDEITAKTNVIVIDKNHVGTGDALILDASNLTYTPADNANWVVVPTLMNEGLDELASRVQDIEDNPSAGDMQKAVYDPQGINQDSFDRNFMTGSQLASTISDFETAVSNTPAVSGSVTNHADVSDAGAGIIPSSTTNADIVSNTAHVSSSDNPHNVTASQIGNTIAQFNADKIQGFDAPIPSGVGDQDKVIAYDDVTGAFVLATQAGAGSGENNDLVIDGSATGEFIRTTKVGSDIFVKGILGANSADVSTVGSDIVIDVVDSAENVRGAIPIASSADMATGTDNTKAVTPSLVTNILSNYQPVAPEVKTTTGAYTLISGDAGKLVKIDNDLTLPVLTTGYNLMIYNTSASTVNLLKSGVTIDNTSDSQIKAKGSISVFYLDTTTAIVDGNTEV